MVKKKVIKTVEVTVKLLKLRWTSKEIYDVILEIEATKGFRGFSKILFEPNEFPTIEYYKDIESNEDTSKIS